MPADDETNGRVTLAVVQRDIQHLSERIDEFIAESRGCRKDHEDRIRSLEASGRRSNWQDVGAYLTAIAAGIAGWLGGK